MSNPLPAPDAVLAARALRTAAGRPAVDFDLRPGTALYLEESADAPADGARWLDLLLGLELPDPDECGTAFYRGRPWAELPPDEAASARGAFGALPRGGGLLMNLDMDENVWLPARWHRHPDAEDSIVGWSAFFGCSPLPQERAPAVSPSHRRRIAWTRAFACNPAAILLENPDDGTFPADRQLLLSACRRALDAGSAIVWIAPSLAPDVAAALSPVQPISKN